MMARSQIPPFSRRTTDSSCLRRCRRHGLPALLHRSLTALTLQRMGHLARKLDYLRQVLAVVGRPDSRVAHARDLQRDGGPRHPAMLIFSFALDLRGAVARAAAPGVLFVGYCVCRHPGLSRSMAREQESLW